MGMLDHSQETKYAPGSQKSRVTGEVLRWHHENGTETVPASEYIEKLESEIRILKQQVQHCELMAHLHMQRTSHLPLTINVGVTLHVS